MEYNITSIKIIAEKLRRLKDNGNKAALLIGAGASITGGIPSAVGMVEELKKKYIELCNKCTNKTYQGYMSLLSPMERRNFIGGYIDKAKINIAHLYMGALVKEKYVDRILTVNFDPLILRALALFNIYPAVYDFAASQHFVPGEAAELSVFYLHGQRDGFVMLNTDEEVKIHTDKLKDVFKDATTRRCWIVVGYSGENDPVFSRLSEIDVFQDKLFWVGYKDKAPLPHIVNDILKNGKYGYYINGYDADTFFLELARELQLPQPDIISKPFTHLSEELNMLADVTILGKRKDIIRVPKRWVNLAIKGFEKGRGFSHLPGTTKKEIVEDEIWEKLYKIWVNNTYGRLTKELLQKVKNKKDKQTLEILQNIYYNWGNHFMDRAKLTDNSEIFKVRLFQNSIEKYKLAIELNERDKDSYNNWGSALSELGQIHKSDKLLKESITKFKKAINIRKNFNVAHYNLGISLLRLGIIKNSEELYKQSIDKFFDAHQLGVSNYDLYFNWGLALKNLASLKKESKLLEKSIEKFKTSISLNPKAINAYYNWGLALVEYAYYYSNKHKKNKILSEAESKFLECEETTQGIAVYILAITYGLMNKPQNCYLWLEKALKFKIITDRNEILKEKAFEKLKNAQTFKKLLNEYLPKEI